MPGGRPFGKVDIVHHLADRYATRTAAISKSRRRPPATITPSLIAPASTIAGG